MVTKIVFTRKLTKANPLPTVSIEEQLELQQDTLQLHHDINTKLNDATRSIEIVEALEDLAVVANSITNATTQETNLIEAGGNIAVAGTLADPNSLIPSMESFIGQSISMEDFKFKEKLTKIWNEFLKLMKDIWKKVSDFMMQSDLMLAHSINNLIKVKQLVTENKGKKVKDTRFVLNMGRFNKVLNNGVDPVSDPKEISKLLENTTTLYKEFNKGYTDKLINIATQVNKDIDSLTGDNIDTVTDGIVNYLKANQKEFFNSALYAIQRVPGIKPTNSRGGTSKLNGLEITTLYSGALGGLSFEVKQPDQSLIGNNQKNYLERLRVSSIKASTAGSVGEPRDLTVVYTQDELNDLIDLTLELLKGLRSFRDDGLRDQLNKVRRDLELVTKNLVNEFDDLTESETLRVKALMGFNLTFISWVSDPMKEMVIHAISIGRIISALVKANLAQYEEVHKPQDNNRR